MQCMKEHPEISLLRQFAKVNVKYEKTTSNPANNSLRRGELLAKIILYFICLFTLNFEL